MTTKTLASTLEQRADQALHHTLQAAVSGGHMCSCNPPAERIFVSNGRAAVIYGHRVGCITHAKLANALAELDLELVV